MLSSDDEIPSGTGDPDSDVPPELFNDLEGKLDTSFVSTRSSTAPDPNDMEPETPRDDFQIEQEPAAPSSKIGQDALDILHAEAEHSSGEKPPAAVTEPEDIDEASILEAVESSAYEETEQPDTSDEVSVEAQPDETATRVVNDGPIEEELKPAEDISYIPQEDPIPQASEEAPADDLDEIRRRIMELETQETDLESTEITAGAPAETPIETETPETDAPEAVDIPDLDIPDFEPPQADPTPIAPPQTGNPFSRPAAQGPRETIKSSPPLTAGRLGEENTTAEKGFPTPPEEGKSIEGAIEDLVAAQDISEAAVERPLRKVATRPFPNIGDTDNIGNTDDLYGASEEHGAEGKTRARKDMFQDVDELSSEIASEAKQDPYDHHPTAVSSAKKAKGGFMKGFKYALLLCIVIGILYMMQPLIVKQIPQAEGFFNIITTMVDTLISLVGPLIDNVKGMIG